MQTSRSSSHPSNRQDAYAFIITSEDTDWRKATRFVNLLLKFGKIVNWAVEPFYSKTDHYKDGNTFEAGSFIVPLNTPTLGYHEDNPMTKVLSNEAIIKEAEAYGVKLHTAKHSFDAKILILRPIKVAIFADGGSPYPFVDILGELGFQKVLSTGKLTQPLTITAHQFVKKAKEKIQKAGGQAIEK